MIDLSSNALTAQLASIFKFDGESWTFSHNDRRSRVADRKSEAMILCNLDRSCGREDFYLFPYVPASFAETINAQINTLNQTIN